MDTKSKLICNKCNVPLVEMDATFKYLKRSFKHKVLRCPQCGQIYLPEELIKTKMADVERALEEK
ncbi:MAG: hypothetical protein VB031_06885 [Eubacteriaceae bacterium]|nr:hypothetical protein [Eubacteriaceae bacterium]